MKLSGRTIFLLAVIAAVLWVGYLARAVVTPLIAALLLAYVLDPVVRKLQGWGMRRTVASGVVVALAFATIMASAAVATTHVVDQARNFYADVVGEPARAEDPATADARAAAIRAAEADRPGPDVSRELLRNAEWRGRNWWYWDLDGDGRFRPGIARDWIERVRTDLADHPLGRHVARVLAASEDFGPVVARSAGSWLSGVVDTGEAAVNSALGFLTLIVLFPIYLYYSLAKLGDVYAIGVRHLPAQHRDRVVDILGKIHLTLSAFFRGRLILLFVKFVLLSLVFFGFGVPFAAVCAVFAALASLVPVLGSIVGGAVAVVLSVAEGSTTGETVGLVAALAAIEVLEGYVLTPAIVGTRVGMHPLTILVATFVAGDLLGIFGMLVAIPLAAIAKILWIEFVLPELRKQAGIADPPPPAEPSQ